jgi:hypothetical protein
MMSIDNGLNYGRNWQSGAERYGYNGMEQDDYLKENNQYLSTNPAFARTGTGNSYTTEFPELDTRIERWWTRDPVFKEWESSYAGFGKINLQYYFYFVVWYKKYEVSKCMK